MENNEFNNNVSQQEEKGLSLKDLFYIVRKHIIAIIIFIVAFSGLGLGLAFYKDDKSPSYTVAATVLICPNYEDDGKNLAVTTQYQLANYLLPSFIDILQTNRVLDPVAEECGVTVSEIRSRLSVSNTEDSLAVTLKYSYSTPEKATLILNSVVNSLVNFTQNETTDIGMFKNGVQKLDEANVNRAVKASSKMKYTVIFFAIGFVVAVVYVALRELFDNSFKSSEQIEDELGLKVIANIPLYEFKIEDNNDSKGENK